MMPQPLVDRIVELTTRYPQKRAALLPALELVQAEYGHISDAHIAAVARLVGVTTAEVQGVIGFYSLLYRQAQGQHVLYLCNNIGCDLCGAPELLHQVEQRLGIKPGETTADGKFTLYTVECLGACEGAPVLRLNGQLHMEMTAEKMDELLNGLS